MNYRKYPVRLLALIQNPVSDKRDASFSFKKLNGAACCEGEKAKVVVLPTSQRDFAQARQCILKFSLKCAVVGRHTLCTLAEHRVIKIILIVQSGKESYSSWSSAQTGMRKLLNRNS